MGSRVGLDWFGLVGFLCTYIRQSNTPSVFIPCRAAVAQLYSVALTASVVRRLYFPDRRLYFCRCRCRRLQHPSANPYHVHVSPKKIRSKGSGLDDKVRRSIVELERRKAVKVVDRWRRWRERVVQVRPPGWRNIQVNISFDKPSVLLMADLLHIAPCS